MADFDRTLTGALRPAAAPDELWARVEAAIQPAVPSKARAPGYRIAWPVAAAAMLALAAGTLWQFTAQDPRVQLQRVALREAHETHLDFHTGNCAELRDWLRHNADLDVPIPEHAPGVELLGARVIRRPGSRIAAIAYRFAGGAATLFVGRRRGAAEPGHAEMRMASMGGGELSSWGMRDKLYTMVSTGGDAHDGCRLCHLR